MTRRLLTTILLVISSTIADTFKESLKIRPLQDGKLHTIFKFELSSSTTEQPGRPLESPHSPNIKLLQSDLIPISILELTERFGINQLSLSLSRGRWEFDRWSEPVLQEWQGYPRGTELSMWLEPTSNATELTNTLAGIFCGSLNRLSLSKNAPIELFKSLPINNHNQSFYHGLLPIEQPCTENLSPLFKLLPCGSHAGLSTLIDPHRLFEGNWNSIRVHLFKQDHLSKLNLEIEIETVLDQVRKTTKRDWDLSSIFGKPIARKCGLTSSSIIEIIEPSHHEDVRPTIHPHAHLDGLPINGRHSYDILKAVLPLQIEMKWPSESQFKYPEIYSPVPVNVKRILWGHGQSRGIIGISIELNVDEIGREFVYFDELPWWLTIYLHTLKITIDDHREINTNEVVIEKTIKPSIQRQRSSSIKLRLKIPKSGLEPSKKTMKMEIKFEYEKDLLLYTEYFSDANRGFDLNPALLIVPDHHPSPSNRSFENSKRFWTNAALIDLATPDFSMPYNVIIVTSTAMALFFGSVFNLLVRDFKLIRLK
ncbi:hypothetical protein MJO29_008689 [Puccinia striiformis f. sp. tritici]|uniref:hypothetical protein n=1 Tax=Puccinia striiformis f. sp. tritici TaxID=168172 RepID=UPI0020083D55|nr:hypothetical protein Pst134EA_015145 [Puccinia striiformis f. sp. tritici]KAH9463058.1 hypothetical protein Pst134EA_015145 [Puccinia striiformis f. sp. tritici]KAI7953058.1 hypothetical protein MJO29_008689 [Puccinia striiformis f. sp. tritici]